MQDDDGDFIQGFKVALYVEALVVVVIFLLVSIAINTQTIIRFL